MELLTKIPIYFLMLISLTGFLSAEMTKCEYSRKEANSHNGLFKFTTLVSVICSILFFILSIFSFKISLFTVYMSVLFGAAVMGQITASAFAMKIGPWAYTAVMMSLSTVIPALSGVFFGEKLTTNIIIGIVLMSICFILSVKTDETDEEKKKGNIKWLILSIIASLCTGGIGILQKTHQTSSYKQELEGFLAISFAVSALIGFILMRITAEKNDKNTVRKEIIRKKELWLIVVAGVGTVINHFINLYLSGAMESGIFFPIMSGGELIFVTVSSILIFKEKLSVKQWIGLICGIIAVVILCI